MRMTNSLVSGGITLRPAWGRITNRMAWKGGDPPQAGKGELPDQRRPAEEVDVDAGGGPDHGSLGHAEQGYEQAEAEAQGRPGKGENQGVLGPVHEAGEEGPEQRDVQEVTGEAVDVAAPEPEEDDGERDRLHPEHGPGDGRFAGLLVGHATNLRDGQQTGQSAAAGGGIGQHAP